MITFIGVLPLVDEGRMSNHAPRTVARLPSPTMVVLAGMRMRTRACCAAAEATRARSSGPLGLVVPHTGVVWWPEERGRNRTAAGSWDPAG
jgi:hypothetical protein